jgi:hypothetical protein
LKKHLLIIICVIMAGLLILGGCSSEEAAENTEKEQDNTGGETAGHDHSQQDVFEWSGIYEFPKGTYTLKFEEAGQDPSIKVAFLTEKEGQREQQDHLALHILEGRAMDVKPGGNFTVRNQRAYNLILNPEGTEFTFEVTLDTKYIIYTEHFAWEFDMKIFDADGNEIPVQDATDHAEHHDH